MFKYRRAFCAIIACCLVVGEALAVPPDIADAPIVDPQLVAVFDQVQQAQNASVYAAGLQYIFNINAGGAEWEAFFRGYFEQRFFTPGLAGFWNYAIANSGTAAPSITVLSGLCAAKGLSQALSVVPSASLGSITTPLAWLEGIRASLPAEDSNAVFDAVAQSLFAQPANLQPFLQAGDAANPDAARAAIQTALTLAAYAPPEGRVRLIDTILIMPESTQAFWRQHGIFLFANGTLTPAHIESLNSLVAAIPQRLHDIVAFVVTSAYGLTLFNANLVTDGQVVFIPAIPMDLFSNPEEFIPQVGQSAAPEFTATAAVIMMRAIQNVQFAQRPDLAARRNTLLAKADLRAASYLRQYLDPSVYQNDPDVLLPATAYMWFIDSQRAFNMALHFFNFYEAGALEAVLLVADMLSGGTDTSFMFNIDATGRVFSAPTAVRYTLMPDAGAGGITYLTGIDALGLTFNFDTDEDGTVTAIFRPIGPTY